MQSQVFAALWRRGLVLGLLTLAVGAGAAFAVPFYAGIGGWWWVLALVALNVAVLFAVVQLLLWPLAVFEHDRPLSDVARDSLVGLLAAPGRRGPRARAARHQRRRPRSRRWSRS